jgi:hypothetical protein
VSGRLFRPAAAADGEHSGGREVGGAREGRWGGEGSDAPGFV